MTIGFLRPTGASADVRELEYVSALHQTDLKEMRMNGSISDRDIVLFLLSRYGIDVTPEEVRKQVIVGLGGGNVEEDDIIDLMEMVAMLLIPTLLKAVASHLPEGAVRPRDGIIEYVLSMILHDTTGSHTPKPLDKELIQRILISYGEGKLASNNDLLEEMLAAAQTPEGTLNLEAFSNGLTSDVELYDISNETRVSTSYDDVFLTKFGRTDVESDDEGRSRKLALSTDLNKRYTAPAIDMVAGTYRSKTLTVLLWATFVVTYFAYNGTARGSVEACPEELTEFSYGKTWSEESLAMACEVGSSVLRWLITFVGVSIYGIMLIGFGSVGNNIACRGFWMPFIGILFIAVLILVPYLSIEGRGSSRYTHTMSFVLGLFAILFQFSHVFYLILPTEWTGRSKCTRSFFGSDIVKSEARIKQAASFKMSLMMNNALELAENKNKDAVLETHFGQGLMAFAKAGKNFKPAGGFTWTWKRIFDRTAFSQEGIWLPARLMASNVTQFIVTLFVLIAGLELTRRVAKQYDLENAQSVAGKYVELLFNHTINPDLVAGLASKFSLLLADFISENAAGLSDACLDGNYSDISEAGCELIGQYFSCDEAAGGICTLLDYFDDPNSTDDGLLYLGLLNASGFRASEMLNAAEEALLNAAEDSVNSIYPTSKYMVIGPFIVGSLLAFVTALSLAVTYIPSVTSTTLQLRSGVIPTLRNPRFNRYRVAADDVTILTGSMFWGCLIAAILVGAIVGVLVFLFLWQATLPLVQKGIAIVIGILVVTGTKYLCVVMCRVSYFQAFYRNKPAAANIAALILECANFALSVGFVFLRMCKLLLAAALYVGRIDTPFLAPGVGRVGSVELDGYPTIFLKDILSHEAHRHPYIELMGVMYLMKLRYGENFGNRAGSTWRLIFVYALMPWLNKYRIIDQDKEEVEKLQLEVDSSSQSEGDNDENNADVASSLMMAFQSLRKNFQEEQTAPVNLMRGSIARSSMHVEIRNDQLGVLEMRNTELEVQVAGLESQVVELEEKVKTLSRNQDGDNIGPEELDSKVESKVSKLKTTVDDLKSENANLEAEITRLNGLLANQQA